jgi:hypothetical protein
MILITATLVITVAFAGCSADSATVTQTFTSRLAQVDDMRASVESRVITLKEGCEAGQVPQDPYCYNGETWYTDNVMGAFNGWITAVQSDLTSTGGLANVGTYDSSLQTALTNAKAFNDWVDEVHRAFVQGQSTGALGGPSLADVAKVAIDVGTAAWRQYREGQDVRVDRLKEDLEGERFTSFQAIT